MHVLREGRKSSETFSMTLGCSLGSCSVTVWCLPAKPWLYYYYYCCYSFQLQLHTLSCQFLYLAETQPKSGCSPAELVQCCWEQGPNHSSRIWASSKKPPEFISQLSMMQSVWWIPCQNNMHVDTHEHTSYHRFPKCSWRNCMHWWGSLVT